MPLAIAVGFSLLAAVVAWADAQRLLPGPVRQALEAIVPAGDATDFISAMVTSLMTVTSITFSVLLIAVQQTASSLTPVVFDQYLRRTGNRVYFGFFVGATAFAFILLAAARGKPAPELGAVQRAQQPPLYVPLDHPRSNSASRSVPDVRHQRPR